MKNFDLAALERRVSALESAAPASLRFGRVTEVTGGKARVQMADAQDVVSHTISTLQPRVLRDQVYHMPDIGEPVACLFSGQGHEEGVVLGAYYNGQEANPDQPAGRNYHRYEDGTEVFYDRESHKLIANVKGDVEVTATGTATMKAEKEILAESQINITLRAPIITLAGLLRCTDKDGNPGSGTLLGHYRIEQGGLDVPDADVTAGAVSVRGHIHKGVQPGSSTTQEPVGG